MLMSPIGKFILFVSLAVACGCSKQKQAAGPQGPPVVPVTVASATQESVPLELRVVGTSEASAIVQVKSQIAGANRHVSGKKIPRSLGIVLCVPSMCCSAERSTPSGCDPFCG